MGKIIGIGNALVDVLATLDNDNIISRLGLIKGGMRHIDETRLGQIGHLLSTFDTHISTGGSAGNTITALASLGIPTGFIGKTGNDQFGNFLKSNLQNKKIESRLLTCDCHSGIASTFISPDGERTFGTYLGASSLLRAEDLSPDMFRDYDYLYIEGYLVQDHNLILKAAELAKSAGLKTCIDMASYNIVENDREFISMLIRKYVDIVFANEEEAKAFTGKETREALSEIAHTCETAVVKAGTKGAYIKRGETEIHVQALPVNKVTDTTGAGDYFAAGFLYGLMQGAGLEQCGKIGALLAGHIIQIVGTQLPDPVWDEIKLNIGFILSEQ